MIRFPGVFVALCLFASSGYAATARAADAPDPSSVAVPLTRPRLDQKLTLEEAVAVALRESPVIRGAVQEVEAAAGQVEAARAERRPWASVNTFVSGGSAPNIVNGSEPVQPRAAMLLPGGAFVDQNLSLMVPIFTGGRLTAMTRQARALHGASQAELETMRQEVALMVRVAYREVQARQSYAGVQRAALQQNRERQRIDQAAYEQEKIPHFYVLRNTAEVANAQQMLTTAERDVEVSLIQLKTLMGVRLDSRLELTEPMTFQPMEGVLAAYTDERRTTNDQQTRMETPSQTPSVSAGASLVVGRSSLVSTDLPGDLARLMEVAARNRPELAAAGGRAEAAQHEIAVARSAYRPQVAVGVMGDLMKQREEPGFGGTTFAATASLPILDGGARKARLQTARAEAEKREAERQQIALQVEQEVAVARLNLRAAESNVRTAQTAITAAEEEYRVALLRYTAGRGLNVEALDALTAQVRAQNNQIQALFEYNVAQDRLARALGLLLPAEPKR